MRFHVDNMMSSHPDPAVNTEFLEWLNKKYGKHGPVTATRGESHNYLGRAFSFEEGNVVVSMADYMSSLVDSFPIKISKKSPTPAAEDLFIVKESPLLDLERSKRFHT